MIDRTADSLRGRGKCKRKRKHNVNAVLFGPFVLRIADTVTGQAKRAVTFIVEGCIFISGIKCNNIFLNPDLHMGYE